MAEQWFLVQFKPNSHNIAGRNLKRQGFEIFLPMQEITRRQDNRFIGELRPFFPGYIFIRLDPKTSPWRRVNSTYGVSRIVSFCNEPTPVPCGLVAALLNRSDANGRITTAPDLVEGSKVRVIEGPFAEFAGTIEAVDAEKRVWLLMNFMGQATRIQVNVNQIVER